MEIKTLKEWCISCEIALEGNTTKCLQCLYESLMKAKIKKPKNWKLKGKTELCRLCLKNRVPKNEICDVCSERIKKRDEEDELSRKQAYIS